MLDRRQTTERLCSVPELRFRADHAERLYPKLGHATDTVMIDARLAPGAAAVSEALADFRLENNTLRLGRGEGVALRPGPRTAA